MLVVRGGLTGNSVLKVETTCVTPHRLAVAGRDLRLGAHRAHLRRPLRRGQRREHRGRHRRRRHTGSPPRRVRPDGRPPTSRTVASTGCFSTPGAAARSMRHRPVRRPPRGRSRPSGVPRRLTAAAKRAGCRRTRSDTHLHRQRTGHSGPGEGGDRAGGPRHRRAGGARPRPPRRPPPCGARRPPPPRPSAAPAAHARLGQAPCGRCHRGTRPTPRWRGRRRCAAACLRAAVSRASSHRDPQRPRLRTGEVPPHPGGTQRDARRPCERRVEVEREPDGRGVEGHRAGRRPQHDRAEPGPPGPA